MNRAQPAPRPRYFFSTYGIELLHDGVPVRSQVLRVHRVGVVVVRVRVLDLHDDHAREAGSRPVLVELVRPLLLRAVVALPLEAVGEVGLQVGVGRLLAPAAEGVREVAVVDHQGVARLRVLVEAEGQEEHRPQVHVPAPELREQLAADALVADVLRVLRRGMGGIAWSRAIATGACALRVELDLARRAQEVAGGTIPLLPFPAVHGKLHHVAIGAAEGLVLVEQRLHVVGPRGQLPQAVQRKAEDAPIHDRLLTRLPCRARRCRRRAGS